jgi:hypothetical protein
MFRANVVMVEPMRFPCGENYYPTRVSIETFEHGGAFR